jgi:hypothetical protein
MDELRSCQLTLTRLCFRGPSGSGSHHAHGSVRRELQPCSERCARPSYQTAAAAGERGESGWGVGTPVRPGSDD